MRMNGIRISILAVQILGILFNLFAIFIKKVPDVSNHIIAICILLTIMILSFVSWNQVDNKNFK